MPERPLHPAIRSLPDPRVGRGQATDPRRERARLRVFCLSHAGGGTVPYRRWPLSLPPDVEVCAVCLPGREDRMREAAHLHMDPLVDELMAAMVPWLDRPFALFGHSLGGLVAYELARRLRVKGGAQPTRLVVSACRPPIGPRPGPPLRHLPDDLFIAALNDRYSAIPAMVMDRPELLAIFIPVLRADISVLETYQPSPGPPLDCPITAFGGRSDRTLTVEDLLRWETLTEGGFDHHLLDGDHFYLHGEPGPFLQLLGATLAASTGPLR
jgi:surfactin synthase thioesterase subunit